jgi:threonine dehydrogenase-like Zn-dependent dehydrogenase
MSVVTDDELRALIRVSVARHLAAPGRLPSPASAPAGPPLPGVEIVGRHASHYQYVALVNVGEACVIEPSVTCNHCGYCRSHGH